MNRLSAAGVETTYLAAGGDGPTIVLLPPGLFGGGSLQGLFPAGAAMWQPVIPRLAEGCRVVALDTLGQGDTGGGPGTPSLEAAVEHVAACLDALGIERAHLVGHDEGAMLAVRLAFQAPRRVASCTIVDSPTVAPSGDGLNDLVLRNPLQPLHSPQALRWVMERVSASPHHLTQELIGLASASPPNVATVSVAKGKGDNFARFRDDGFPVPAMLVWGQQDPLCPPAYGRALFDIIAVRQPATQFHVLNQAGYFSYREQPGLFSRLVAGFVKALR